jgi:hypothetical protein
MIEAYEEEAALRLKQQKQADMARLAQKEQERSRRGKERRAKEAAAGEEAVITGTDTDTDTDDEDVAGDDAKVGEDEQINVGNKMNANRNGGAKMSVRNLRIREDTAKYAGARAFDWRALVLLTPAPLNYDVHLRGHCQVCQLAPWRTLCSHSRAVLSQVLVEPRRQLGLLRPEDALDARGSTSK